MLEARERLRFDIPCEEWVENAFGLPGLFLTPPRLPFAFAAPGFRAFST
jgi:hypothetical protein